MAPPPSEPATAEGLTFLAQGREQSPARYILLAVAAVILLIVTQGVSIFVMYGTILATGPLLDNLPESAGAIVSVTILYSGMFGSFGVIIVLLAVVMPRLHGRSWRTLVAADRRIDWALLARSALLWGAICVSSVLIWAAVENEGARGDFDLLALLSTFVLTAGFVLIQASAEELLFRGYLSQGLHSWLRRPWLIALPIAVLFAAAHLLTHSGLPTFLLMVGISLFLSWVTWRADRLEPAIGIHFAQNAATLYLMGLGVVPTPSVYRPMTSMDADWTSLVGLAVAVGLYVVIGVRYGLVLRR